MLTSDDYRPTRGAYLGADPHQRGKTETSVVTQHPNLAEAFRRKIENLHQLRVNEATEAAATDPIRNLIEEIVLTPREDGSGLKIELEGALAGLLALSEARNAGRPRSFERGRQLSVVAGARFELTTFRL